MAKQLKYIIPPVTDCFYLTAGKKYEIVETVRKESLIKSAHVIIMADDGSLINTNVTGSAHLKGKDFSKIYD